MNSYDSWSCLSVQKFFSFCNWQGQQQDKISLTKGEACTESVSPSLTDTLFDSGEMTGQSSLIPTAWEPTPECLALGDLVATGSQVPLVSFAPEPDCVGVSISPLPQSSWQCRSVQDFFSLCNWKGQLLENRDWHHADPSSRLTLQVREFFQFISWEGSPEIGSLPKGFSISEPIPAAPVEETTFTDLFDLF